jgi:hypothetical protein
VLRDSRIDGTRMDLKTHGVRNGAYFARESGARHHKHKQDCKHENIVDSFHVSVEWYPFS